ncbi:hypothetical protein PF005_g22860 [Phytophthora fragariae]|nr:hypothetical protein PF003_g32722 [Phytophthora fragariae]KAE9076500.1 hypothetical protein PF007_g24607 [Phytophthora fragariae]KAE9099058.1 hypothetical protein PF006_g23225 [Phytophthora fragariae]KAE9181511.1 hypothetical protein PF005_g22860 [Phytophthora fragariae]KAE9189757.1 hypothetical protein PF002_g24958 [Phytophthora fragariae]
MTVRALTLLFAVALVVRAVEFEEEDDVLVLMLTSEYTAAAKTLNELNPSIRLIKGDATDEIKMTEQFAIRAFPTLNFFNVDVDAVKDYDGGRTSAEIEKWVAKKSGPAIKILESVKELMETKELNDVVLFVDVGAREGKSRTLLENLADADDQAMNMTFHV